jgi:hypothetical protein
VLGNPPAIPRLAAGARHLQVEGASSGSVCTGWVSLKVTGKFPLITVAGATAAGMTVLGGAGMASAPRRPKVKVGRQ